MKNKATLRIKKAAIRFGLSKRIVYKWDKGITSKSKRIC